MFSSVVSVGCCQRTIKRLHKAIHNRVDFNNPKPLPLNFSLVQQHLLHWLSGIGIWHHYGLQFCRRQSHRLQLQRVRAESIPPDKTQNYSSKPSAVHSHESPSLSFDKSLPQLMSNAGGSALVAKLVVLLRIPRNTFKTSA